MGYGRRSPQYAKPRPQASTRAFIEGRASRNYTFPLTREGLRRRRQGHSHVIPKIAKRLFGIHIPENSRKGKPAL